MKIHSDSPLSKIDQLFNNLDQNLSKNQYIRLQFKLNGYKEKKLGQDQVIIETSLIDGQYSQTAILIGKAAELIKVYQNEKFINVNSMVIQLLQWKVAYLEKNKAYTIVIYEFQYIGSLDGEHECTQYNVDQNCQSQKKLRVTIKQHNTTNNNTSHQSYITNSIKKVKIENSSFIKESFIIDDNLLNISVLDNPANNKQSNQFKDYQQQQLIQQQELTKISVMYPNMKKWVLEGRIILKSEQLDFRCKKTDMISRYFKIIILDCEQEIIVGLFYEKALSKFFSVLQQGKVYTFKNGCIGQDKANGTKKITFNEYSIISESQNFAIPSAPQLNFSTLQEIETLQHNSIVDVVAVIQEIKQDSDSCKSFIVFDQTTRLSVKLWGAQYANINLQKGEIMVFKGLKFYNTNFKSLNSDHQTMIIQNHDLNEVKQLKSWLAGKNIDTIMKPNPDNSTIDLQQLDEFVIKLLNEGKTQQTSYKYIFGYIIELQENRNMYPCCPSLRCKSKMEEIPSRKTYRCKKCLTENPSPKFSFVLRVTIMDEFTNIKAVIFDDIAVKLLGITADQLRAMSHEDQRNIFLSKEFQQKKMKVQIQFQDYNGQIQPKYNVQDIVDIDYKELATQAFEMFDELDNLLNLSLVL
ncbi:unnamed protein product (macronuclear) [Paramecium tetraurelia]|uniref:Replication factor A C-terminal domain-containing protein n=1 Tax=Paramecium tetraurelia TaxID=5888 RepID=A0BC65_PARTE|nr:uncharacterized protein GSPATT00004226001 [Paramecium tetraurelia]CAK56132.1 unnamed protein product [Paramecium tetraurelia]|eukprot:XP_001423530.1 hypothetical protein (macronuclear) [Paramecium tetraurelia strain d4-2]